MLRDSLRKRRVKSLFANELDGLVCSNMPIHSGQHFCAPLTELVRYTNSLIKLADRKVRTFESSKDRLSRSAVKLQKSYTHTVMSSDDGDQKNTSEILPKTWNRRFDDRRQSSPPPSSHKTSWCQFCLKKRHSLLQCPYVSIPSVSLQKREDKFRSFDCTIRFYQLQLSHCRGNFCRKIDGMKRGHGRRGSGRRDDRGKKVFNQQNSERSTNSSVVLYHETKKK